MSHRGVARNKSFVVARSDSLGCQLQWTNKRQWMASQSACHRWRHFNRFVLAAVGVPSEVKDLHCNDGTGNMQHTIHRRKGEKRIRSTFNNDSAERIAIHASGMGQIDRTLSFAAS